MINIKILNKKQTKLIEENTDRWENILNKASVYPTSKAVSDKFFNLLHIGKNDLIKKCFGRCLYRVRYTCMNRVWGLSYKNFEIIIYVSEEGLTIQANPKIPSQYMLQFINEFNEVLSKKIIIKRRKNV